MDKTLNKDILLANVILANSNKSGIKCPFCGSENVKVDDVHFSAYKIGDNNVNRKMYICQDCESAFSVPVYDKATGKFTHDDLFKSESEESTYDPSEGAIDATDFFNQLAKLSGSQIYTQFDNLQSFIRSVDSLICLVIFEDGTVHYVNTNTTLKNIRSKMLNGLKVDAVVKFTKKGIYYINDLLNTKDAIDIKFSAIAKLLLNGIIHPKKDTDKKKK